MVWLQAVISRPACRAWKNFSKPANKPKGEAVVAEIKGTVRIIQSDKYADMRLVRVENSEMIHDEFDVPKEWKIQVKDEDEIKAGDVIATMEEAAIAAEHGGKVRVEKRKVFVSHEQRDEVEHEIPTTLRLLVKEGDHVDEGQPLTEGSLNPHRVLRVQGREACQMYLLTEIQKVYRSQGQNIHDKHFEVIIRKMMSKVQVTRPGETRYLPGDAVERLEIQKVNEQLLSEGKVPAKFHELLLGVTKASLSTDFIPLGFLVPAYHQGAGGGGHRWNHRPALWPEGERHHWQADPGRDRLCPRTLCSHRTGP